MGQKHVQVLDQSDQVDHIFMIKTHLISMGRSPDDVVDVAASFSAAAREWFPGIPAPESGHAERPILPVNGSTRKKLTKFEFSKMAGGSHFVSSADE